MEAWESRLLVEAFRIRHHPEFSGFFSVPPNSFILFLLKNISQ